MAWASTLTAPLGLTEPLFVPAHWNPASAFDLAHRTGFGLLPWNPIYAGIAALIVAAMAGVLCRLELWRNTLVGGLVFLSLYAVFLAGLEFFWPGYVEAVWNFGNLIARRPAGLPLEGLLFSFAFGMCWNNVYEDITWRYTHEQGAMIASPSR